MRLKKAKESNEVKYTDVAWRKLKDQWFKVWLNGKKIVKKEAFDRPFSD